MYTLKKHFSENQENVAETKTLTEAFCLCFEAELTKYNGHAIEVCNSLSAELKFMYHAFPKPNYTNKRVYQFLKFNTCYDSFGERLARRLDCPYDVILVSVHDILTFMTYYGLWGTENELPDSSIDRFNNILTDAAEYKKQVSKR